MLVASAVLVKVLIHDLQHFKNHYMLLIVTVGRPCQKHLIRAAVRVGSVPGYVAGPVYTCITATCW
jgi:hypothetical protein